MKNLSKLIRRFLGILILTSVLLIALNIFALATLSSSRYNNTSPWKVAYNTGENLKSTSNGYILSNKMTEKLKSENIWAIFIDNKKHEVLWKSENVPNSVPTKYTIADISNLTRGYICDYPTFTSEKDDGLIVLGYPKDSFWKLLWPSWDYHFIANLPYIILTFLAINIGVIFIIYLIANGKLLKSTKPIAQGIQKLPTGEFVHIKENGLFSELATYINKTSQILQQQNEKLRKKESARANWIAGVSHDIRTPLSMIMGYASQLESSNNICEDDRKKASVILKQSEKMRNLISDLNLASKLEYNMQPIKPQVENAVSITRQVVVDFINMDIYKSNPIEWTTSDDLICCFIDADKNLLKRAITNLVQNCINHNENGCKIYVSVKCENEYCFITVEDDGVGVSDKEIEKLNNAPHYMVCDENVKEQRHGLGLLIVKQILSSHNGKVIIKHSSFGGFAVELILPIFKQEK